MYIVQNLKSKLYGIVHQRITWHSIREFATWFETREDAEAALEKAGVDRDQVRIIKVGC